MIERERKFKLKYLPEGLTPIHIKQAYLMFDKKKHFSAYKKIATTALEESAKQVDEKQR